MTGLGFCDDSTEALVIKRVTIRGRLSKIVLNCVTSFMDDPLTDAKTDHKSKKLDCVYIPEIAV